MADFINLKIVIVQEDYITPTFQKLGHTYFKHKYLKPSLIQTLSAQKNSILIFRLDKITMYHLPI